MKPTIVLRKKKRSYERILNSKWRVALGHKSKKMINAFSDMKWSVTDTFTSYATIKYGLDPGKYRIRSVRGKEGVISRYQLLKYFYKV